VVLKSAKKDDSNLAREIHHHRQFVHPHIARLYEVIVTETLVWLALEYCPGMTVTCVSGCPVLFLIVCR
jgi:serine/threonine protein kinase